MNCKTCKVKADGLNPGRCEEIWKPIKGYEGIYEVSNLGSVRSLIKRSHNYEEIRKEPLIMKLSLYKRPGKRNSKLGVVLNNKGRRCSKFIAPLVLRTFVGDPPKGFNQAVFKNKDRFNCSLSNLFWGKSTMYQNFRNGSMVNRPTEKSYKQIIG